MGLPPPGVVQQAAQVPTLFDDGFKKRVHSMLGPDTSAEAIAEAMQAKTPDVQKLPADVWLDDLGHQSLPPSPLFTVLMSNTQAAKAKGVIPFL